MNSKKCACPGAAAPDRLDPASRGSGFRRVAAAGLLSLAALGISSPASAQFANRLGLCELSAGTITALQADVDRNIVVEGTPEIAFVVVYSITNDNNGQALSGGGTSGPILCGPGFITNPPFPTDADADVSDIDILDAAEAFLLRYEGTGGSSPPETRFCHTTNANVDCYRLPD